MSMEHSDWMEHLDRQCVLWRSMNESKDIHGTVGPDGEFGQAVCSMQVRRWAHGMEHLDRQCVLWRSVNESKDIHRTVRYGHRDTFGF